MLKLIKYSLCKIIKQSITVDLLVIRASIKLLNESQLFNCSYECLQLKIRRSLSMPQGIGQKTLKIVKSPGGKLTLGSSHMLTDTFSRQTQVVGSFELISKHLCQ